MKFTVSDECSFVADSLTPSDVKDTSMCARTRTHNICVVFTRPQLGGHSAFQEIGLHRLEALGEREALYFASGNTQSGHKCRGTGASWT